MEVEPLMVVMVDEWKQSNTPRFWEWAWEHYPETMKFLVLVESRRQDIDLPEDPTTWTESRLYENPN